MHSQATAEVHTTIPEPGRFGWVSLVALGGAIFLLAPVVPMVAEGFDPFFAILLAPLLVGLFLLRFARKIGIIWLGIVSLVLLVMNAGFIPDALKHPESPADFVPVSMLTVGGLIVVMAAIPAFRVARGRQSNSRLPRVAAAVAVVLVAAAAAGSFATKRMVTSDAPGIGGIALTQENFAFGPETITAQSGEVSLHVTNNDSSRHTFTVDELGVDVSIAPGQSRLIRFDADPGSYRFYCMPHDPGMDGDLIIQQSG
jgi:plastocyanin